MLTELPQGEKVITNWRVYKEKKKIDKTQDMSKA